MSITVTKEKHFLVLLSIFDLSGGANKKQVLDNIQSENYFLFSEQDLMMKSNRPELHWRNDLAFVRKYLVSVGYINDNTHNLWSITETGVEYLNSLCEEVINYQNLGFQKITPNAVERAYEILAKTNDGFDLEKNDLVQDGMMLPNETQEAFIKRIKRYKKIVDEIKKKYDGRCQIENCGYTFLKSNGENYAEGHHLIPLAKGGNQTAENVVILCANHHRMLHYAKVEIGQMQSDKKRSIFINNEEFAIVYAG